MIQMQTCCYICRQVSLLSQREGQKELINSRVSVPVLDATQVSLDRQQDSGVSSAAVLQQGGGGLPGALRGFTVEGGGWKQRRERAREREEVRI